MIKYNRIKTMCLLLLSFTTEIHTIQFIIKSGIDTSLSDNIMNTFLIPMLTDMTLTVPVVVILCYYFFRAYKEKIGIHNKGSYWRFVLLVILILLIIVLINVLMNDKRLLIWGLYSLIVIFNLLLYYGIVKLTEIRQDKTKQYKMMYKIILGLLFIYNIILWVVIK